MPDTPPPVKAVCHNPPSNLPLRRTQAEPLAASNVTSTRSTREWWIFCNTAKHARRLFLLRRVVRRLRAKTRRASRAGCATPRAWRSQRWPYYNYNSLARMPARGPLQQGCVGRSPLHSQESVGTERSMSRLHRNQDTEETSLSFHIHIKDTTLFFLFGRMDVSEAEQVGSCACRAFETGERREDMGGRGRARHLPLLAATRRTHQ